MPRALPLHLRAALIGVRAFGEGFSALFHHAHRIGLAPSDAEVRIVRGIPYGSDPRQAIDVYLPAKPRLSASLPTLVFVHGGGWIACNRTMSAPFARTLAARGFAVVTPGYRLLPHCDREAQRSDVRAALSWVMTSGARRFDLDLLRMVMAGESAGAHLMMRTVQAWDPGWPKPRGLVGMYGMYDVQHLEHESRRLFEPLRAALTHSGTRSASQGVTRGGTRSGPGGGPRGRFAEMAHDHSALRPLPWSDVPVLLLHGESDVVVPVSQSHAMHDMLREHGHDVRLRTYAGGAHGFIYDGHPARRPAALSAYRATLRFLLETTGRSTPRRSPGPPLARSLAEALAAKPADRA